MPEFSYNIDNLIDREVNLDGKPVTITAHEVTIIDDRQFLSGSIYYESSGEGAEFLFEIEPQSRIEFPKGQMNSGRQQLLQDVIPEIFEKQIEQGVDAFTLSSGENFDDARSVMRDLPEPGAAPIPDVPEPEVVRAPEPANLKPGEPIVFSDIDGVQPILIDGFEVNGQTGDLVVHNIEFVDEKPYLSGTFSVEIPTGSETREFAIAIDAQRFPSAEELSAINVDDLKQLTSQETVVQMVDSRRHDFVLSMGESFPDRARAIEDIDAILKIDRGVYADDMQYLIPIGQEHPGLAQSLSLYTHRADMVRSEEVLKLTVLDHVGVEGGDLRARLVYETGGLDDFYHNMRGTPAFFDAGPETTRAAEFMAQNADKFADGADASRDTVRTASIGAKFLRASGAVAGPTVTLASVASTTYASELQRGYAETLLERGLQGDPAGISQEAYDEYIKLNIENNVLLGVTDGGLDWLGPVGQAMSFPAEYRATQSLKEWSDEYAPHLSDADFQTLAQGMISGHTAKTEMLVRTAGSIPHDTEGQQEVWHDLIEARNEFFAARADAINQRGQYAGRSITQEQEEHFDRLDELSEMARTRLISEMESFMDDPDNAAAYMDMLPVDDRLTFLRRLAESDPNPEITAAAYPEISAYLEAYENANILQTGIFGFDEDTALRESMEIVSAYIMDRAGLFDGSTPNLNDIRHDIDQMLASGGIPDSAPPELAALAELQGSPELQSEYFAELQASGFDVAVQRYADLRTEPERQAVEVPEFQIVDVDVQTTPDYMKLT